LKVAAAYRADDVVVVDMATGQLLHVTSPGNDDLPTLTVKYVAPTYIYVPVQPPPPPQSVSILIRLLNAPSMDASKGFDVQDLLARLAPKVLRAPLKPA
jgi:hypothetical protein